MEARAIYVTIGGINLKISGRDTLRRAVRLDGLRCFRSLTEGGEQVELALDCDVSLPECRWLYDFELAAMGSRCRFGVDAEGVCYYDFGGASVLRFDPRRPARVELSPLADLTLLRFALWVAYSMAGLWFDAVPIHSSVVVCDGRAVLCLGESGTGKSTHTQLWIKHLENTYLLNDDSPILRLEGDEVVVYGSPWSGKLPCFRPERVPVAALVRLEQRPANSIRRLSAVEAVAALLPSYPPSPSHLETTLDRMATHLTGVVGRVPVFRLGCLPDEAAARLCHDTVFAL